MKSRSSDYWLTALAVLFLAGMVAVMHLHTLNTEQAARIAELEAAATARAEEDAEALVLSAPLATYVVSSPAGVRTNPLGGGEGLHRGADLVGPSASWVLASAPGIVIEHWLAPGIHGGRRYYGHPIFGGYIILDHGDGVITAYGHLSATNVHTGDFVERGQMIGVQGNTGMSRGEHLHWETITDPIAALRWRIPR